MALTDILATLANRIGTDPLSLDEDGGLTLEFDETLTVSIEAASMEADRFSLTAAIGALPVRDREAFLQEAMAFNLMSGGAGGPILGLDDGTDTLVLVHNLDAEIEGEAFLAALDTFLVQIADWRDEIAAEAEDQNSAHASPAGEDPGGLLRV